MIKVFGDLHFIENAEHSTFEDADIVVMPGGADWGPNLYNQNPNSYVSWVSSKSDTTQMALIQSAIKRKKLVFGICRGLQGVTIANGGTLVQHISHPSHHRVTRKDGSHYMMNSCHHQLCNPYNLNDGEYEVLGWTEGLSNVYLGEEDRDVIFPKHAFDGNGVLKEPEVIWYPKTRCLGTQGHPEWMSQDSEAVRYVNHLINKYLYETAV